MTHTRLATLDDAPALAELLRSNREFLAPWEPVRDDVYATPAGQRTDIDNALEQYAAGYAVPHVIVDADRVVGRITLTGIVRGPFQSCHIGYWLSAADNGRGIATAAVAEMKQLAFDVLDLHRIQAATLLHNSASQRVLERNGFVRFGLAPAYLKIAGRWQDHVVYQVITHRGDAD
ncbi:MAG: GNAT family protein [Opitutaceae bacterium]